MLHASVLRICRAILTKLARLNLPALDVLARSRLTLSVHDELVLAMPCDSPSTEEQRDRKAASRSEQAFASPTKRAAGAIAWVMTESAASLVAATGHAHVRGLMRQAQLAGWLKLGQDRRGKSAGGRASEAREIEQPRAPTEDEQRRLQLVKVPLQHLPAPSTETPWAEGQWVWADARRCVLAKDAASLLGSN